MNPLRNPPQIPEFPNSRTPDGAAGEEDDPLEPLVVEEVVEGPEAPVLAERVRRQVGVVAEREGPVGMNSRGVGNLGIPGVGNSRGFGNSTAASNSKGKGWKSTENPGIPQEGLELQGFSGIP